MRESPSSPANGPTISSSQIPSGTCGACAGLRFLPANPRTQPTKRSFSAMRSWMTSVLCFIAMAVPAHAYTVVTISTAAPAGIEQQFISATTNQYNATYFKNPFASNTYQLQIYGPNPSFAPALTSQQLLDSIVTVDSYTYVLGWANGESYQQFQDIARADLYVVNCSTPSFFTLVQSSSKTFNAATCVDVLNTLTAYFFHQSLSTPTVVPGNFQ